ncbi:MAG: M1 family aminopeptidase, partial [Bacteroidia bacterium]|nr:M1 family metallopeptidase [Bacteroidia bacterium]MDW8134553.1 M1 family aminopeptidase [Bacteroidia bacterium]
MRLLLTWLLVLSIFMLDCSRKAHDKGISKKKKVEAAIDSALLDEPLVSLGEEDSLYPRSHRAKLYRGSYPIVWQLIHTDLSLRLDWEKREIPGEAQLTLKPYFTPQRELSIDAKSFQIEEVRLLRPANGRILSQRYDTLKLTLVLDRYYTPQETLIVYIRYRAQPEKIGEEGSAAIGGRKGGYFINADGSRPCTPRQFWTQGEPESASAWFPTLDSPNQKTTQRLCITLDDSLVSLSNGLLISQKKLPGGFREDCWELNKPHSPYLFALVVGPFRIVKDKWRNIEVAYYMEPGWENEAQTIFGRTPQMIEFFSQRLGIDFPWPKYSQVIVRDFVSGAMENTTAVIHGDILFYDKGTALTQDREEVVAHELFHHWFGNLVSCEGWAQLPLNESFADYSEYLWLEHSRGIEEAELHRRQSQAIYLSEAIKKKVPLIRYDYKDPMEMFDAHSYQKGGLTLHLLRKMVGDSAFFLSLREYLTANAYRAADIDHLRHAFEKVTGQDWTWFFDQHFHRPDEVRVAIQGEQRGDSAFLKIFQLDYDTLRGPYRYFLRVAVFSAGGHEELPFELVGDTAFVIFRSGLRFVDVDPERLVIGRVQRKYPLSWWEYILTDGKYFLARVEALEEMQLYLSSDSEKLSRLLSVYTRGGAMWQMQVWEALGFLVDSEAVAQVLPLARQSINSPSAYVRAATWSFLLGAAQQGLISLEPWLSEIYKALGDSSTEVQNSALVALYLTDSVSAKQEAYKRLGNRSNESFLTAVGILMRLGDSLASLQLLERYPCMIEISARAQAIGLLIEAYSRYSS